MAKRDKKEKDRANRLKYQSMIRKYGDPILSQVCDPILPEDDLNWLPLLEKICKSFPNGVGLAAPQAGISKQAIFIYHGRENGYFMLNPVILQKSDIETEEIEGCLSYPEFTAKIKRPEWIVVQYETINPLIIVSQLTAKSGFDASFNMRRTTKTRKIDGFEARIVCHELDHCQGVNIWDKGTQL